MGDRANVYIQEDSKTGVYLYTHWAGSELPETVRAALVRGEGRWNDNAYLARIVFCEMVKGNEMETTSYGISSRLQDNEYPIIVLDCDQQRIGFAPEPTGGEPPIPSKWTAFRAYVSRNSADWPKGSER